MVYTLPPRNSAEASFGNQIGSSISKEFLDAFKPAAQQQYQRGQLQRALNQLRTKGQDPNATPADLLYNLIEASSYSPEIGRNLPQLYAELNKAREAAAMKNVDFGGEQPSFQAGGISAPSQPINPAVQEAISQDKFFPTNVGAKESPGNFPQEATGGEIRPILSGDEEIAEAQRLIGEYAKRGVIKTLDEVLPFVQKRNQSNIDHNTRVENERERRIAAQEKYGSLAEERLKKLIPDASDEEVAIFKKIGEDAAGQGKSQAEIDRFISKEVSKHKNSLSNIQKNLEAPRIQNKLQRSFLGKGTDIKSVEQDARSAVKPLIDLGLYEKARTMLSDAGFYPEERETIIFGEMPKDLKKQVDSISKATFSIKGEHPFSLTRGFTPPEREYDLKSRIDLFENISKVWGDGENKNINLLQLRKAYEDKGYDWRIFKDAMNELVNNEYIKLTDDQMNTLNSYLDNPPLNNLEKILHGLGLRGR